MRGAPTELDWEAAGWSPERSEEPDVADEDLPSLASIWSPILLLGGLAALVTSAIVLVPVFLFARGLGSLELWPEQSSTCAHPDHDLHLAAASGAADDVRSLVADGADVDATEGGWTPLACAVDHGRPATTAALLDLGADPDLASGGRPAPVAIAAGRGDGVVLRELLDAGADPDSDAGGTTALHQAAEDDRTTTIALLADAGASLETRNEEGATPLLLAVWEAEDGAVAALLDAGADPNTTSAVDGEAAGIAGPDTEAAEVALRPLDQGRGPLTALHVAARLGDVEATRRLLEAGADPDAVAYRAYTPLHVTAAVQASESAYVAELSPEDRAAFEEIFGNPDAPSDVPMVEALLLLAGADPDLAPDPSVGTPADLAASLGS